MKYSIETTENGVNETLEVDGNLYKKEWEREVTEHLEFKGKKNMAWYALYKWYKDWSRIGYPNMISWYSEKLNPPKWTILKFK